MFTMELMFGKQNKVFKIMPDTSTSWIWVTSVDWIDDPNLIENAEHFQCGYAKNKFDRKASSTFIGKNKTAIWRNSFHSYEYNAWPSNLHKTHNRLASGELVSDYVGYDEIIDKLVRHDFIYANKSENLGDFQGDGSLGLNTQTKIVEYNSSTFTNTLFTYEVIKKNQFGIYFKTEEDKQDSFIFFGDHQSYFTKGEPEYFKVKNIQENPWDVTISKFWYGENVWVNGTTQEGFSARYYSGYSSVGLPVDDYKDFFEKVEPDRKKYRISGTPFLAWACESRNNFQDFQYKVGNKTVTISRYELMIRIDQVCIFYIYPLDQDYVILGIPAMRGVPLLFDLEEKRIGIYNQTSQSYDKEAIGGIKWIIIAILILVAFVIFFAIWCYQRTVRHRKQRLNLNYLLSELQIIILLF